MLLRYVAACGRVLRKTLGREKGFPWRELGVAISWCWNSQFRAALMQRATFVGGADMTKRHNQKPTATKSPTVVHATGRGVSGTAGPSSNGNGAGAMFSHFAAKAAQLAGKPLTFLIAVGVVLAWAISG